MAEQEPLKEQMKVLRRGYGLGQKTREQRAVAIDAYLGDESAQERPLVVFQHIQKTAGTALRLLLYANHQGDEYEVVSMPRRPDKRVWWTDLYESRKARLACVAGHGAAHLLAVVRDRPVVALTVLRSPVDRVHSRYHFLVGHKVSENKPIGWSLDKLYVDLDAGADSGSTRVQGFCNGQARSLLVPHYDVSGLPLLADDPESDLWRERLFDEVEPRYLVGVQERFQESIDRFADRLDWTVRRAEQVRVNKKRPPLEELSQRTEELIRRYNWLDEELHERVLLQFDGGTPVR